MSSKTKPDDPLSAPEAAEGKTVCLSKLELSHILQKLAGELLTYESYEALGKLRPNEQEKLYFLRALYEKLNA